MEERVSKFMSLRKRFIDVLIIVFSVLLGLVINNWNEEIKSEKELVELTDKLRIEIEFNRNKLDSFIVNQEVELEYLKNIQQDIIDGARITDLGVNISCAKLRSSSWQAIFISNKVNNFSYSDLESFSRIYEKQNIITQMIENVQKLIFSTDFYITDKQIASYHTLFVILNQLIIYEKELLRYYDVYLEK